MQVATDAQGHTAHDLVRMGMPDKTARSIHQIAQHFYGPTKFSGYQRDCIKHAFERNHSVPTLEVIVRYSLRAPSMKQVWQLCKQLCRMPADTLAMEKLAKAKLKEMRDAPTRQRGITVYRRKNDLWTMAITGTQAEIADIEGALDKNALWILSTRSSSATSALSPPPRLPTSLSTWMSWQKPSKATAMRLNCA